MRSLFIIDRYRTHALAITALTLALLLTPAGARADGQPKSLYLVSVGITNAIGQPVLKATKKDALDMAKWAHSQQGKLFGQVHVQTITNEHATGRNVLAALARLQSKARPGDYVMFYISSHGAKTKNGEYYFCAYDGNVYWHQITDALRNVPGVKFAILDTCFAGAATSGNSIVVMAACGPNQFSHDGSSAGGNSIYTQFLLEGLYGKADRNKNGIVSLSEAAHYASAKLHHVYDGKPAKNQQFSALHRPKGVSADLPLAKLGHGTVTASTAKKRLAANHKLDGNLGNQENGNMKTTVELPDALVKQIKLRALRDGMKLKEAIADLLRKGLAASSETGPKTAIISRDRTTGMPLIHCAHAAEPGEELTPERVAEILSAQESEWHGVSG